MSSAVYKVSTASRDLWLEWRSCCLRAGGWNEEIIDAPPPPSPAEHNGGDFPTVNIISLVDVNGEHKEDDGDGEVDGWLEAVHEIEANLERMLAWLQEKKWVFLSVDTPDEEASLIQSTIASYTASTANELEELNSVLHMKQRQDYVDKPTLFEHHSVIVQTLLQRLKEDVAEPFGKLQKQRQREAVKLWHNPLSVELYEPPAPDIDEMDAALGLSTPEDRITIRPFEPRLPRIPLQQNFMNVYAIPDDGPPPERPESLFVKRHKRAQGSPSVSTKPVDVAEKRFKPPQKGFGFQRPLQPEPIQRRQQEPNVMYAPPEPDELQQEAVLLKASLENDLDQVLQMESTMVVITKLLSQFSDLVATQHDDVVHIHDAAETTKDNMEQGEEKLRKATDQTEQSRHYMATAITAMGFLLLFVHWIRP